LSSKKSARLHWDKKFKKSPAKKSDEMFFSEIEADFYEQNWK
jgi:hypothetical protein